MTHLPLLDSEARTGGAEPAPQSALIPAVGAPKGVAEGVVLAFRSDPHQASERRHVA